MVPAKPQLKARRSKFVSRSARNSFLFLSPSVPGLDDFSKPSQRIGTLRRLVSEDLEVMRHVFPAFEDDIRSLILAVIGECPNAVVQNLGGPGLYLNRWKVAQVSP